MTELPFELRALAGASNYQRWIVDTIEPCLGRRILEVGAGVGNMSRWLPVRDRLIVTEGDEALLGELRSDELLTKKSRVSVRKFNLLDDDVFDLIDEKLDTVVSFNVLEHIEDDASALRRLKRIVLAGDSLRPRRIVSFVPAQQWAYGSLDRAFGHFRRYTARRWRDLHQEVAPEARLSLRYFNPVGLLGWVVNGRILKRNEIGAGALRAFERILPVVRPLDYVLHGVLKMPLGQSIVATLEWPGE